MGEEDRRNKEKKDFLQHRYLNSLREIEKQQYQNSTKILKRRQYKCSLKVIYKSDYLIHIFQLQNSKMPPVVLMNNKKFRHILVEFGTGRVMFPDIYPLEKGKVQPKIPSGFLQNKINEWLSKTLSKDFELLIKDGVYPVNLEMWNLYINESHQYLMEIDKTQNQQENTQDPSRKTQTTKK